MKKTYDTEYQIYGSVKSAKRKPKKIIFCIPVILGVIMLSIVGIMIYKKTYTPYEVVSDRLVLYKTGDVLSELVLDYTDCYEGVNLSNEDYAKFVVLYNKYKNEDDISYDTALAFPTIAYKGHNKTISD